DGEVAALDEIQDAVILKATPGGETVPVLDSEAPPGRVDSEVGQSVVAGLIDDLGNAREAVQREVGGVGGDVRAGELESGTLDEVPAAGQRAAGEVGQVAGHPEGAVGPPDRESPVVGEVAGGGERRADPDLHGAVVDGQVGEVGEHRARPD